ncbi:sporulation protein YqfD [Filibacter tadaridae]|uniref:Stage IV sporulation protein YqfD n=1 Tax=Filibacter tadaridae TaxID=2483811 RepID=A0A3P5XTV4_9BACL|nr:sporulation protein YqfD [Filibacter tadaridae]VDC32470.1 Putative stage IV sporulation protein YqfD [Filibacter tadaridae]
MVRKRYDVKVSGKGDISGFLTKLVSDKTKVMSLSIVDGVARFQTDKQGISRIRRIRRRYGLKILFSQVGYVTGAQRIFSSYRFLIACVIPFAASFFLWTIEVESDIPEVVERIEQKLEKSSIIPLRPLMLIPEEGEIRRDLMLDDPSLSWVRFKRVGTSLTIIPMLSPTLDTVTEKESRPSDLVARTGGVISRFELKRGERVGHVHQTVKKGDVLATGTLEQGDKTTVVGAEGAVFADYWMEYTFSIPKTTTYRLQGEEVVELSFSLPWKETKDQKENDGEKRKFEWPFVKTDRHTKVETGQFELTKGMEETVIVPLLKNKYLSQASPQAIIKDDKILHVTFDNDKVSGTILFHINDNIAIKRPISQGD